MKTRSPFRTNPLLHAVMIAIVLVNIFPIF